jgi:hypothetical protein
MLVRPQVARLGPYYFNARWYAPTLGRFITEDPARSGTSWYAYCSNNPLTKYDPTGLEEKNLWRQIGDLFKEQQTLSATIDRARDLGNLNKQTYMTPGETEKSKVKIEDNYRNTNKRLDSFYKKVFNVPETPTLTVDPKEMPQTAENIKSAQDTGRPTVLAYAPEKAKQNRNDAQAGSGLPSST